MINEYKLNIFIRDYTDAIKKRGDFWGVLGVVIALAATLYTSEFKNLSWASGETIRAGFLFALVTAFLALCRIGFYTWKSRDISPDSLVTKIKTADAPKEDHVKLTKF